MDQPSAYLSWALSERSQFLLRTSLFAYGKCLYQLIRCHALSRNQLSYSLSSLKFQFCLLNSHAQRMIKPELQLLETVDQHQRGLLRHNLLLF